MAGKPELGRPRLHSALTLPLTVTDLVAQPVRRALLHQRGDVSHRALCVRRQRPWLQHRRPAGRTLSHPEHRGQHRTQQRPRRPPPQPQQSASVLDRVLVRGLAPHRAAADTRRGLRVNVATAHVPPGALPRPQAAHLDLHHGVVGHTAQQRPRRGTWPPPKPR